MSGRIEDLCKELRRSVDDLEASIFAFGTQLDPFPPTMTEEEANAVLADMARGWAHWKYAMERIETAHRKAAGDESDGKEEDDERG